MTTRSPRAGAARALIAIATLGPPAVACARGDLATDDAPLDDPRAAARPDAAPPDRGAPPIAAADAGRRDGDDAAPPSSGARDAAPSAPPSPSPSPPTPTPVDAAAPDAADAAPDVDAGPPRTVFVSSALYTGDLGGLSGADAKCQSLAAAAGLSGTYRAWLSDDATSAAARVTHALAPYRLVDGTVVAARWAQLASGTLLHAIDRTERGQPPPVGSLSCGAGIAVWTATTIAGDLAFPGLTCNEWTGTGGQGAYLGSATERGSAWTQQCFAMAGSACASTAAIYCVEQ